VWPWLGVCYAPDIKPMRSDNKMWLGAALAASVLWACDLEELSEGTPGDVDGSTPVDTVDASDPVEPVDAGPPPIDAAPPSDAGFGTCERFRWTASASASHPTHPPAHAIDGLLPSRYSSGTGQGLGQYFQLDFGGLVKISKVSLEHGYQMDGVNDYPRAVDVLGSTDGVSFTTTLGSSGPVSAPGPTIDVAFDGQVVSSIRLQLAESNGEWWWSLHELHVDCEEVGEATGLTDAGPTTNTGHDGGLNPNRSAWTSSSNGSSGADPAIHAYDGDEGTRWASGKAPQYGDEYYRLDLGAQVTVTEVRLSTSGIDFPSAYVVEVSLDDNSWKAVASGLGSTMTKATFARTPARYVRVRQVGTGHDAWWGINEITIVD
jgi:hypothetical protein